MAKLEDILTLEHILECIPEPDDDRKNPGLLAIEAGKYFLEAAYDSHTLEQSGPERLITNLHTFDCFTYVESCLALALMIPSRRRTWNDFSAFLTKIRYRDGVVKGYSSRLHYFSDWLQDNVRKGILRDVTSDLKGMPYTKDINFMTAHPDLYPALADPDAAREIADAEMRITNHASFYIPVSAFEQQEFRIKDGDIIGITSATPGLDVQHAGLAAYEGETLHLLHASQQAGKVILSTETLGDYLRADDTRTGMMVGRIKT